MKQAILRHALSDAPTASDFDFIDAPDPACPEGGVLIRPAYVSLDPYVGSRLRGRHMGEPAPEPGSGVIPGAVVGEVVESDSEHVKIGQHIFSMEGGWRELAPIHPHEFGSAKGGFRIIDPEAAQLSAYVGALGMPGLTAWAGVTQLARVTEGDVFCVDAATGPVGGTAGQIARVRGATTVGIAGGPEKCAVVTDTYRFDHAIDYKAEDIGKRLGQIAPDGISVHFENVSDAILATAMSHMKLYGRGVLCGLAAHYHADGPAAHIPLGLIIGKRATLMGLVVYDFYSKWDEFTAEMAPLVKSGEIVVEEDLVEGLEAAPALMEKLMQGRNVGKAVVKV